MILAFDQSVSKIGYALIRLKNNRYSQILNEMIDLIEKQNNIIKKSPQKLKKLNKRNYIDIDIIKENIKFTKKEEKSIQEITEKIKILKKNISNEIKIFENEFIQEINIDIEIKHGVILSKNKKNVKRLEFYYNELTNIIKNSNTSIIALEGYSYNSRNTKSIFEIGEIGGILKLIAQQNNKKIIIIPPKTIKKSIAYSGNAEKEDVINSINNILKQDINITKENQKNIDDIYDAISAGIFVLSLPFMDIKEFIKVDIY